MKYDGQFPYTGGLPDAPLAMPKQQLELRRRSLFHALRDVFSVFATR
ncbi:hypothetical protein [Devosia sp. SL43]|nr:hypothetical protein [Devosia sp. SL43]UJW85417.1 hypothetical protein IM737_18785 [Devosia sp. SL43]